MYSRYTILLYCRSTEDTQLIIPDAPDIDPANNGTLAGTLQFCFKKFIQNINGMLPAKVIAYDRTTNRVQVQLLISIVTTDGKIIPRSQIASLPVLLLGGGGFFLSFNLNTGDLGWVLANDRDISLFLQNYEQAAPNTARIKNFADGLFIPDVMTGYEIASEDMSSVVLQNLDGTIKISLQSDRIKLTAPLVEITGGLQVDGVVTGEGASALTINSPVIATDGMTVSGGATNALTVTGNERVVGDITASGSITPFVP
jgi:hypothetical protein